MLSQPAPWPPRLFEAPEGDQAGHASARSHPLTRALEQLNERGFVTVLPQLAARLGFKPSIFLGHALYWTRHLARTEPSRRGWFYMTARQCEQATSLTQREQGSVREDLVRTCLIEQVLTGQPAKLHYRVNLVAVRQMLGTIDVRGDEAAVQDRITSLLQTGLRFYKPLADIGGSLAAGLYLSYLLEQQRKKLRRASIGADTQAARGQKLRAIFPPTEVTLVEVDEARQHLGLGTKAIRNARERLKAAGLITERRALLGQVPTVINLEAVLACLSAQAQTKASSSKLKVAGGQAPSAAPRRLAPIATVAEPSACGAAVVQRSYPVTYADRSSVSWPELTLFSSGRQIAAAPRVAVAKPAVASRSKSGPAEMPQSVTKLLMGLFAAPVPCGIAATNAADTAAVQDAVLPERTPVVSNTAALANLDRGVSHFAVLSKLNCRFVEPDLPFCRNTQGIARNSNTTTTALVDSPAATTRRGRRRGEQVAEQAQHAQQRRADSLAQQQSLQETSDPKPAQADLHSLILPRKLAQEWHADLLAAVALAPVASRQLVLDELTGQLESPSKQIHNPPGWLRGLIQRLKQGQATFALASKVRAEREQRTRLEQHVARLSALPPTVTCEPQRTAGDPAPPSPEATAGIERLKAMKSTLRQRNAAASAGEHPSPAAQAANHRLQTSVQSDAQEN